MKQVIFNQLVNYLIDNLSLARRLAEHPSPANKPNLLMIYNQSFGAVDILTNVMEYSPDFTKQEVEVVHRHWELFYKPLFEKFIADCEKPLDKFVDV